MMNWIKRWREKRNKKSADATAVAEEAVQTDVSNREQSLVNHLRAVKEHKEAIAALLKDSN